MDPDPDPTIENQMDPDPTNSLTNNNFFSHYFVFRFNLYIEKAKNLCYRTKANKITGFYYKM